MTTEHCIKLIHFLLRIPMYVIREEKDVVVAYIHGFDIGSDCRFIAQFSDYIENQLNIERRATGWVGQIERLAKRRKKEWIPVFKKEALKFLISKLDEDGLKLLYESLGTTWFAKNLKKHISLL
jgi:hypothetical protein